MHLGFTFDEKILTQMTLDYFLNHMDGLFTAVELAPDPSLLDVSIYKKVVQQAKQHHFHIPYFVKDKDYYDISDFTQYENFYSIIESFRQYSIKTPALVMHPTDQESTLKFIDRQLNFIEQKKIDLKLAIENIPGFSPHDLLYYLKSFNSPSLVACYDFAHDYYSESKVGYEVLSSWLYYIHLHGKSSHKHQSIKSIPRDEILSLPQTLDINLELLYDTQEDYFNTLIHDLKVIQKIKRTPSGL